MSPFSSLFFLFVCFQTSDRIYVNFLPYFNYNSAVFYGIILQDKLHSFSIQDDRNTHFPSTINYKNNNIIERFYIEFTIRRDCSVRLICHYVVCGVITGLEQNFRKKYILIQLTKSPVRPANSEFCQAPKLRMSSCRVFEGTLVMKKRSQNHFRLHFTS